MSPLPRDVSRAFARQQYLWAKITPTGFAVDGVVLDELCGTLVKTHLVRKRFHAGALVCDSRDGVRARDGTVCDHCRHPECRPQIRAHLESAGTIIVLDLAASSARNLVVLEEEHDLHRARLRLRVTDRGRWGEVSFEVLNPDKAPDAK